MIAEALKASAAMSQDAWFIARRLVLGKHRARRTRLYCVGAPKSGTHSIAEMFTGTVRARHEPGAVALARRLLDRREGRLSEEELQEWLRRRDRELALEVDSAASNYRLLDFLLSEFPDARFVLTVRDCYSIVNSQANQWIRGMEGRHPVRAQLRRLGLGEGAFTYVPEEKVLEENGLPNLDSYLSRWTKRIDDVIAKVPADRLFIVRTDQIKSRAAEIAAFAGLPPWSVRVDRAHAFKNPAKRDFVREIDRNFLERKVEQHCRARMSQFFPEIKSLDDVKL